ncbi:Mitochondrial ATPase complex subunit atp10 [Saitoella coloradoensis]
MMPHAGDELIGAEKDSRAWKERMRDKLDHEKMLEKGQKNLVKFLNSSYWNDFHAMKKHMGKHWIAPRLMFRKDKALYMPNLKGRTLNTSSTKDESTTTAILNHPVTLVSIFSSRSAEEQAATFSNAFREHFASAAEGERPGMVSINVQENPLKAALVWAFLPGIRKSVPPEEHDNYFFITTRLPDELRYSIGYLNTYVGYTYLLDSEARIRWAACGDAEEVEKSTMIKAATKLLADYKVGDRPVESLKQAPKIVETPVMEGANTEKVQEFQAKVEEAKVEEVKVEPKQDEVNVLQSEVDSLGEQLARKLEQQAKNSK